MSLNKTFQKAARTIFKVFKSLIFKVEYAVAVNAGFDSSNFKNYPVDMIIDSYAERDVQFLSFSNLIQPTDVKGLVRGEQLRGHGILKVTTLDKIVKNEDTTYAIIAYDVDAAEALYTLLLRKV